MNIVKSLFKKEDTAVERLVRIFQESQFRCPECDTMWGKLQDCGTKDLTCGECGSVWKYNRRLSPQELTALKMRLVIS